MNAEKLDLIANAVGASASDPVPLPTPATPFCCCFFIDDLNQPPRPLSPGERAGVLLPPTFFFVFVLLFLLTLRRGISRILICSGEEVPMRVGGGSTALAASAAVNEDETPPEETIAVERFTGEATLDDCLEEPLDDVAVAADEL